MDGRALVYRAAGRWRSRTVAAAAIVFAEALAGCTGANKGVATSDAVPVQVRQVRTLTRFNLVEVSGDVEASQSGNVGFQVPGRVTRVWPDEGQVVQAGEPLAQLDTTGYQLQLGIATAATQEAEDQYHRLQQMYAQKGIAPADFVKSETGFHQAQAQQALVRQQLIDTRLVAPIAGVVARRGIEVGEQAAPGIPVFTIVATDPVQISAGVPEAEIGGIRVGQSADIRIPALPDHRFDGRVKLVPVVADPVSRTYAVRITVPNPGQVLRPGMIAEARIQQSGRTNTLTVPASAIVPDADGATQVFIYHPADRRVYSRRVTVGSVYGTEVEITSGLTSNDMIVVGGQSRVDEGTRVTATDATAAGATARASKAP